MLAGTLHHDFEIIGQVADVGHQIAIVFLEGCLAELPAQERVARHHLFHDRFPARPCIMICQGIPPVRHRSFHAVCMRSAYVHAVSYINSTQKSNTCSIVGRAAATQITTYAVAAYSIVGFSRLTEFDAHAEHARRLAISWSHTHAFTRIWES